MNLPFVYDQLKNRFDRVNFSALWTGFHPFKFALYNDKECYYNGAFVEKTSDFMANTAIKYKDEHIAIWYLESEPDDFDCLAASLIHEMFHAFQQVSGETRYPNEFEALFNYNYSIENISIKISEAKLMNEIITNDKTTKFGALLKLRRYRKEKFEYEFDYESMIEQIEGTACYIEISALRVINPVKAQNHLEKLLHRIVDPKNYLPIRVISYETGAMFIHCIQKAGDFNYEIFDSETFGQKIIKDIDFTNINIVKDETIHDQILAYKNATNKIIEAAIAKNKIALSGKYPLCGLNIYDARWNGRYAVSNYFVSYKDKEEIKVLSGNYVLELDDDLNVTNVYYQ